MFHLSLQSKRRIWLRDGDKPKSRKRLKWFRHFPGADFQTTRVVTRCWAEGEHKGWEQPWVGWGELSSRWTASRRSVLTGQTEQQQEDWRRSVGPGKGHVEGVPGWAYLKSCLLVVNSGFLTPTALTVDSRAATSRPNAASPPPTPVTSCPGSLRSAWPPDLHVNPPPNRGAIQGGKLSLFCISSSDKGANCTFFPRTHHAMSKWNM